VAAFARMRVDEGFLVSSFPNSVWERQSAKLCFAHRAGVSETPRNRSFAEVRSQTEFGNESLYGAEGYGTICPTGPNKSSPPRKAFDFARSIVLIASWRKGRAC